MKKMALCCAAVLVFFTYIHTCQAQNTDSLNTSSISLSAFVEETEVPQNRFAELVIRLQWDGDLDRYEVHPFENPILQNFKIQGSGSTNRSANIDGKATAIREYRFTLKPEAIGMGYVESFIIKYTDLSTDVEHRLTTNRIPLQVIDPLPDPTSKTWLIWPAILLAAAVGAFFLVRHMQKKKAEREKIAQENAAAAVPIEEKYLAKLKELADLNEPTLDCAKAYSGMSRLLRRFLHERFDTPGLEATTTQVADFLYDHKFNDRIVNELKEILSNSDIIKFSGKPVDRPDLERAYTLVESIFQKSLRGEVGPHMNESTGESV